VGCDRRHHLPAQRRDGEDAAPALIKKIDELPFPAYHLYDIPKYMRLMVNPGVTLITSRGCPYACTFCDAEMTPRAVPLDVTRARVRLDRALLKAYDPPQFMFFDDLFTIQRKRVIAICKEIVRRGLFFEWACESRLDTMDFEMLRWMKKAGCVKIYYGLESGSPDVLVSVKKGLTKEKIVAAAKLNREVGMSFKYFLIYGFPQETQEGPRADRGHRARDAPRPGARVALAADPGHRDLRAVEAGADEGRGRDGLPLLARHRELQAPALHLRRAARRPREAAQDPRAVRTASSPTACCASGSAFARMIKNPELIGDFFEVRRRRAAFRQRVRQSVWGHSLDRKRRDEVALQCRKSRSTERSRRNARHLAGAPSIAIAALRQLRVMLRIRVVAAPCAGAAARASEAALFLHNLRAARASAFLDLHRGRAVWPTRFESMRGLGMSIPAS
jgi:hypothetical protein